MLIVPMQRLGFRSMSISRTAPVGGNFIESMIKKDLDNGKFSLRTRFPPEPNGYLHVGHAKSIVLNFELAQKYGGKCNLRFDDSNPTAENQDYVDSIKRDVEWLGYKWDGPSRHASDYFDQVYEFAKTLVKKGKAYVCSLDPDKLREMRGSFTKPGQNSPFRDRSVEENLKLLEEMKRGEHGEHKHMLRAKIDMAAPNQCLRDPVLYRIRHVPHHRTGSAWCIYPTYDFIHCLSDHLEDVTHSLCTLEFSDNRALYEWVLDSLDIPKVLEGGRPRTSQTEFSRMSLRHTITSKRYLRELVDAGYVTGWDDPRMPTLSGMRRRGYPPQAIQDFCRRAGVTRDQNTVEPALLEHCTRQYLEQTVRRVMCVLRPLKVVITNWPEGASQRLQVQNHPQQPGMGTRILSLTRVLFIDKDDFCISKPNKSFKRLVLDNEVRLRYGYVIKCHEAVTDAAGEVVELRCTYDPETLGKNPVGRKVKGVVHWVSAVNARPAEVRLYGPLLKEDEKLEAGGTDRESVLNPDSLQVLKDCYVEQSVVEDGVGTSYQFEREGYFCIDKDSTPGRPVFNRTVALR